MTIVELAKECECDPITIKRWAKDKYGYTYEDCGNNKKAQGLTEYACNKFRKYWKKRFEMPKGYMSVRRLAEQCGVDPKTIRIWAEEHKIKLLTCAQKNSPPFHIIDDKAAAQFGDIYKSDGDAIAVQNLLDKHQQSDNWRVPNKWAKREGKTFVKIQTGGRSRKGLLPADAAEFEKYLIKIKEGGFFYMIQLIPEYNPNRIKFGFGYNIDERLRKHRVACPNAKLLGIWPCQRDLEKKAIHDITNTMNCLSISSEVFECDNYGELFKIVNDYFYIYE